MGRIPGQDSTPLPRRKHAQKKRPPRRSGGRRESFHWRRGGLSNREIGASLFLSPKTVERHLSSVFRKRGFRSRTELAARLRDHQAVSAFSAVVGGVDGPSKHGTFSLWRRGDLNA